MDLTISRPVRIFALVAVVAAVGGIAMLMLRPKTPATPPVVSNNAAAPLTKVAPQGTSTTPSTASSKAKPPVITSVASPKATATATARTATVAPTKPAVAPAVAADGLPAALASALHKHRIVVVSVFDPESQTDAIAYAEAKAGAAEADTGFVAISLLDSVAAGALTTQLPGGGLLPSPGILIYRRPDTLVYRLDGFADRDTVAQAAAASTTAAPVTGAAGS